MRNRVVGLAGAAALAIVLLLPGVALAHPLGNFTINHYAGIRVSANRIELDVVIDQAEIPTFTERQRIDADGDGQVSDAELETERRAACPRLANELSLTVNGSPVSLGLEAAGLSFPQGAGGLSTMRVTCEYVAALGTPIAASTTIHFADTSNTGRIGWREIVAVGDRVTLGGGVPTTTVSKRLTSYPQDLLSVPLATAEATFTASAGGPAAAAECIPDAFPIDAAPGPSTPGYGCGAASAGGQSGSVPASGRRPASASAIAGAVPGGVGREIADLLQAQDLTPPIVLVSLLSAMVLGAAHAITPGHGKTVMAAYLVGTRGTARHAVGLGLTVTVSHTIGVLVLAFVVLAVSRVTPESFNHVAGIISGLLVIAIGGWLFLRQGVPLIQNRVAAARDARAHALAHAQMIGHEHGHDHGHVDHGHDDHGHDDVRHAAHPESPLEHSHGGIRHSHLPPTNTPLTWRSLFALGLFGGLVPSINALIILLATVATGRAAYGIILVVAFGAGMAVVLGGIGLGLVYASRWMARNPSASFAGRLVAWAPALTALVILAVGVYVTSQAVFGNPVL